MILVSVPGCNVPGYQEECWHCLFLAVPDPGGAVQRMLCRKSGTKLAGQESTEQDRGKKGLECAPMLANCQTHSQAELNRMYSFQFLLILFLLRYGLCFRTCKVKVNVTEDSQP